MLHLYLLYACNVYILFRHLLPWATATRRPLGYSITDVCTTSKCISSESTIFSLYSLAIDCAKDLLNISLQANRKIM